MYKVNLINIHTNTLIKSHTMNTPEGAKALQNVWSKAYPLNKTVIRKGA